MDPSPHFEHLLTELKDKASAIRKARLSNRPLEACDITKYQAELESLMAVKSGWQQLLDEVTKFRLDNPINEAAVDYELDYDQLLLLNGVLVFDRYLLTLAEKARFELSFKSTYADPNLDRSELTILAEELARLRGDLNTVRIIVERDPGFKQVALSLPGLSVPLPLLQSAVGGLMKTLGDWTGLNVATLNNQTHALLGYLRTFAKAVIENSHAWSRPFVDAVQSLISSATAFGVATDKIYLKVMRRAVQRSPALSEPIAEQVSTAVSINPWHTTDEDREVVAALVISAINSALAKAVPFSLSELCTPQLKSQLGKAAFGKAHLRKRKLGLSRESELLAAARKVMAKTASKMFPAELRAVQRSIEEHSPYGDRTSELFYEFEKVDATTALEQTFHTGRHASSRLAAFVLINALFEQVN